MGYQKVPNSTYDGDGEKFVVADHVGSLLEIQVLTVKEMETVHGPGTAVGVDIRDITGGKEYRDQLLFQAQLVGALRHMVGGTCLAYLRVGVASKPGKTPPYLLIDASEDPAALAAASGAAPAAAIAASPESDTEVEQAVAALGELLQ